MIFLPIHSEGCNEVTQERIDAVSDRGTLKYKNGQAAAMRSAVITILLGGCLARVHSAQLNDDPPAFISGAVFDAQSAQPIPDVNVSIIESSIGTTTDGRGNFFIGPLTPGTYIIEFTHVYYHGVRDTLYLNPGDTVICEVLLAGRPILLDEVEVTDKHPKPQPWKGTSGRVMTRKEIEGFGSRDLSDIIRLMSPGVSVTEVGSDLFIDLNRSRRRTAGGTGQQSTRTSIRDYIQNNNPLIILNGMRIGKSPVGLNQMIKPEEIDEIVVLNGIEADMYGHEGRDGVILIQTTPQPPPTSMSRFMKLVYIGGVALVSLLASLLLFQ